MGANGIAATAAPAQQVQSQATPSAAAQSLLSVQTQEVDPFDYHETVNVLTIQFLSEHEETRVAALKWLIMLHQKLPKKVRCLPPMHCDYSV